MQGLTSSMQGFWPTVMTELAHALAAGYLAVHVTGDVRTSVANV